MPSIEYAGISPDAIELINSKEFRSVLDKHPNLRLVTVDEDDDGYEVFNDVALPVSEEHDDYVGILDTANGDEFMWILYDDYVAVSDPSFSFVDILKAMDAFSVETLKERIFQPTNGEHYVDDPAILAAEFDFNLGTYII